MVSINFVELKYSLSTEWFYKISLSNNCISVVNNVVGSESSMIHAGFGVALRFCAP